MTQRKLSIAYSVLALATVLLLWIFHSGGTSGVALLLVLCGAAVVRYRFRDYTWLAPLCAAGVAMAALFVPILAYGAIVPVTAAIERKSFWLPPVLIAPLLLIAPWESLPYLLAACAFAALVGLILLKWRESEASFRALADRERTARLTLESTKAELLAASRRAGMLAQSNERARIARDIHDHAGHELTGVLLALQTVQKLMGAGDDRAPQMLAQATERLKSASDSLRETVHNLKPDRRVGMDTLRKICAEFEFCPCDFICYGNFSEVPGAYWELLESMLKEILTNVARHSSATRVSVRIDASSTLLRLAARDNGTAIPPSIHKGLGLTGMRERCTAYNGHLSIDCSDGFMVVGILPMNEGGLSDE